MLKNEDVLNAANYLKKQLPFKFDRTDLPGMVVAISHKGKLVLHEAYGYADVEKKKKMQPDDVFRIASHSKTFTATAIMQLQEQGKLKIDDPVCNHLEWLKDHNDKNFQKITIRQLLSHSAGVIRDGEDADYWQLFKQFPDDEAFKKEILSCGLVIENNTKLKYSNYGYTLLGMVIIEVSGKTYNDYVQKNIVDVLGLNSTWPEINDSNQDKIVTGYTKIDARKKRLPIAHTDTRAMSSATGFCSSAAGLCTYFSAHNAKSNKLLSAESKKEMQKQAWEVKYPTNDTDGYGLGFQTEKIEKNHVISHGGGFPGQSTKTMYDPKNDLVVVVLTNAIDGPAGVIAHGIMNTIHQFTPDSSEKEDLSKFEGRFMSLWSIVDIVKIGGKCYGADPESWEPIKYASTLEYVDRSTLKITEVNSFYSEGENVAYSFDEKGKAIKIRYAGATMYPEAEYLQEHANKFVKMKSRKIA